MACGPRSCSFDAWGQPMIVRNGSLPELLAPRVEAAMREDQPLGVMCIGMQGLRRLRIHAGYETVDDLLRQAAERLNTILRPGDALVELGSGDFGMILPGLKDSQHALLAAARVQRQFESPFQAAGQPVLALVSVGVAMCPEHGDEPELLCRQAEQAMLQARYEPDHMLVCKSRISPEGVDPADLLVAINESQLSMWLQPILDVRRRKIVGAEALARWQHPQKGTISPGVFIPVAEGSGMISHFTRWSINACLQQVAEARNRGLDFPIALNLSATAFAERGLVEQLLGGLKLWDVAPRDLVLEVTETAIVADVRRGAHQLQQLNAAGVRVSIDDFGVGNASVSYLKEFPATEMKIDQSFVTGMLGDLRSLQIVKAMISFAHQMGMRVVAEGVEDKATLEALGDLNCNLAQGWEIGKPKPAAEFMDELAAAPR